MLVRAAEERDRAAALETLTRAFAADPMLRYLGPDEEAYPGFAAGFRHGEGLGGAVSRAVLDDPIAAGDPAYLVTGTEGNLAIYRRLGFGVIAETDIGGGPHLWGMWRPVRLSRRRRPRRAATRPALP